ncbi:MAG: rhodanese-like domain-containing protein [Zetaproteobacteria bacterium CG06_land_8_20_14_3_00_59_53]|nr:MAG: rhodanese [Zetaproteobacteria bacterium CG2_30_59_37]PIO89816.1 MAG: rhodanese [Zetaproteobacteria bacterium CG23_combo_of_CG06-09_8_20_14_all_59_86]PIQ64179.1 MAG: rhodanese [Zetaproteobacteria bacterium CG11_big_fil_rev_8_21_14_0_20_59_439]PIU69942.1 MAG: rhodanese-like domain-containing protein [Zetaproteobacteria bacterium CG06_land_8_20_14_3_00_59_53]PIU96000.1 MAG: rhodanese-like domain-containing protein [Zetaproteobacteria bacterium CG03_land_8_20_14_0_80_59_51]PIY45754.1 MAG: 
MSEWMQANAVYLFLALLTGWMLWQRLIAPMLSGVKRLDAADYMALRNSDHVLLDVRSDAEWTSGHAPKAMHIPLGDINRRMQEIPAGKPVVVVCASGNRSAMAATALAKRGFTPVYNFSGGMGAWRSAGLPVKSGR